MSQTGKPIMRDYVNQLDKKSGLLDLGQRPELRDDFVPKERQSEDPCRGSRATVEISQRAAACRSCGATWSPITGAQYARLPTHPIRLGENGEAMPGTEAARLTSARAGSLAKGKKDS